MGAPGVRTSEGVAAPSAPFGGYVAVEQRLGPTEGASRWPCTGSAKFRTLRQDIARRSRTRHIATESVTLVVPQM